MLSATFYLIKIIAHDFLWTYVKFDFALLLKSLSNYKCVPCSSLITVTGRIAVSADINQTALVSLCLCIE